MNKPADEYKGTDLEGAKDGGSGISLRRLKTFESFKTPAYRIYYGAMAGQWLSMNMEMVVRPLLAYRITGSGAILGGLSLAHAIPLLLISLFGGAIADRVQKKKILVAGQASSAVVSIGIALALTLGYLGEDYPGSWWLLAVSAVLQGIIMGFMMPSRTAIIPELVGEEQVMNAISLNNMGMNTFRILGPALGGFLVASLGFGASYYTTTGVYIIGALFAVSIPHTRAITAPTTSTVSDIVEGVQYIRHRKTILLILAFSLLGMVFGMPYMFLMPMFTEDILKVGATGMGIVMMVAGVGAIIGSLTLASLPNRKRGLMLIIGSVIMGLALVGFSFSHWWAPSLFLIAFVGLGQTSQQTLSITLAQAYVDADYRGRVLSFLMMGIGFASIGTFLAGILAEAVGIQWSIGGFAMAMLLASLLVWAFTSRLRELD